MKKIIGLTGPSGAGKSTISAILQEAGAHVIDGDIVARRVVEKGKPALIALTETFGAHILLEDGALDRKALAKIAFSTPENLHKLNQITHKYIIAEIKREIEESACSVFVIDAAALFESGLDGICHKTVSVTAERSVRIGRIMARDGLTVDEATARIDAQQPDDFYISKSDFHVENTGAKDALSAQVNQILKDVSGE